MPTLSVRNLGLGTEMASVLLGSACPRLPHTGATDHCGHTHIVYADVGIQTSVLTARALAH